MNAAVCAPSLLRPLLVALLCVALVGHGATAQAHVADPSAASAALSALPVAVSVGGSAVVLSAGAVLTVVAVQVVGSAVVWTLEAASTGARVSLRISGKLVEGVAVGVGTVLVGTALSTGLVLSAASEAVAFIPNQVGASLLYNETIVR